MKVKSLLTGTSGGKAIYKPAPSTDHDPLEKGLSLSIDVGTRKMVNYA